MRPPPLPLSPPSLLLALVQQRLLVLRVRGHVDGRRGVRRGRRLQELSRGRRHSLHTAEENVLTVASGQVVFETHLCLIIKQPPTLH